MRGCAGSLLRAVEQQNVEIVRSAGAVGGRSHLQRRQGHCLTSVARGGDWGAQEARRALWDKCHQRQHRRDMGMSSWKAVYRAGG
jgi:hypothetical protein